MHSRSVAYTKEGDFPPKPNIFINIPLTEIPVFSYNTVYARSSYNGDVNGRISAELNGIQTEDF